MRCSTVSIHYTKRYHNVKQRRTGSWPSIISYQKEMASSSIKSIKIAHWNANGLKQKLDELRIFMTDNDIDIMAINETKFTSKQPDPNIPGYDILRRDRPTENNTNPGGGVLIFVRNSITYTEISHINTTSVENIGVRISNICIFATYVPRQQAFTDDIEKLLNFSQRVIILGDLNAKHQNWNCNVANSNGTKLNKFLEQKRYVLLAPENFTHYPSNVNHNPSIIDIAIVKNIKNISIDTLDGLDSDHIPVMIDFDNITEIVVKKFYNFSKANWNKFRQSFDSKHAIDNNLKTIKQIEKSVKKITDNIQSSIKESIPYSKPNQEQFFNQEIKNLIAKRNRFRRIHQRTGDIKIKQIKNNLTNEIKLKISQFKKDSWNKKLSKLNTKDGSLWKLTKHFTRKTNNKIPTLHSTNGLVFEDKEKTEVIANQFEKVHTLTKDFSTYEFNREIKKKYKKILRKTFNEDEIDFIFPREIKKAIKSTKARKAPGLDGIQNIILKNLPTSAICQLANIFNACLKLSYFPKNWKLANILPFKKPGKDKAFPQNYRPISLLPTMSKIFEKTILNRILKFEKINKTLINEQFGFRERRSTVQQLIRITDHITFNFNINKSTAMVLIDIEKAFDTVWHKALIHILYELKMPIYIIKIIASYLYKRKFVVSANNQTSGKRKVRAGVPQGSILGPVLFLYFINNIPKDKDTQIGLFADDTTIYASSWSKLLALKRIEKHLHEVYKFFHKWKIKINITKTELIIFSRRKDKDKEKDKMYIMFQNQKIEPKNSVKYLGVTLDKKLKFVEHINNAHSKASAVKSLLYNLINQKSCLSAKNKIIIYKMLIRPIFLYAAPIWSSAATSHINKLEVFQNKLIRWIDKSDWDTSNSSIRSKYNINSVTEQIYKLTKNFFNNQTSHINILQNIGILNPDNAPFKIRYKLPHHILL